MSQRLNSIALVVSLAASAVVVSAPTARALTSVESCFFQAINRERASVGHRKLALYADLTAIARRHSKRMAEDGTIYHNNNLGNEISGHWWAAGENVGMGPTCKSIHDAFMSSPGHRSNIIDTDYNQVGVGVSIRDGTIYVTEDFAGRPMSGSRPRATIRHVSRARRPAPKPRPAPPPAQAEPRTVDVLLRLIGLDADRVDPATGQALGV
jgi:Cysteine-rich secretory protein family